MARPYPVPPLGQFVSRRFAAQSPFWSWMIFERIGGALAYLFAITGVPPAAATMLGGAAGISGAAVLGIAREGWQVVLAGALLLLAYSLDCSDGQLARATGRASARGGWLDVATDAVVICFVSTALTYALVRDGGPSVVSLFVAAAFGASRTASLFTSTLVRSEDGGLRLTGLKSILRTAYVAAMDTPFVYVLLCATRLETTALQIAMVVVTVLTVGQTVGSAQHHFRTRVPLGR